MSLRFVIILFFLVLAILPAEAQCAMCRAVLESEEDGAAAEGINNGIIYLMIMPYLMIAGVGYAIYRIRKGSKPDEV